MALTSAGIIHEPVAAGSNGVTTKCGILLRKPITPAKLYRDWRGIVPTQKYGAACAVCYQKEGEK